MTNHDEHHDNPDNHDHQHAELTEEGRRLASQRDNLIAAGVDPNDLKIPIAPPGVEIQTPSQFANGEPGETITADRYLLRGGEPSTLDHAPGVAHHTVPAHDAPRTHTPGTAATSDARKRHTEQQTQTPTRPPFGVSAFERAQWRRDSANDARGIVSLNARVLALLDALDQAESAVRTQKTKRRRIRQRADQLLAERDLARLQLDQATQNLALSEGEREDLDTGAMQLLGEHVEVEAERDELAAAVSRVERLCREWDLLSKGETITTAAIRQALAGERS